MIILKPKTDNSKKQNCCSNCSLYIKYEPASLPYSAYNGIRCMYCTHSSRSDTGVKFMLFKNKEQYINFKIYFYILN